MEENPLHAQLDDLASSLRKYRYDIIIRNRDWLLQAKLAKPNLLIILVAIILGFLHISQQKVIIAMLDFLFAISFMIMAYIANKKYELVHTDIDHLLIAPDGITVNFKNKRSVHFSTDQIESLEIDVQYKGNNSIVSILLFHSQGLTHELVCMMSKKEEVVTAAAEKIIELMKSTILFKAPLPEQTSSRL